MSELFPIERDASMSPCGQYRWSLSREWDWRKHWLGWVMLNPSTADAQTDDPTIRKCIGFAQRWGFGGIAVRNLFALRATDPATLIDHPHPTGDHIKSLNRGGHGTASIYDLLQVCPAIVLAWGGIEKRFSARALMVIDELEKRGAQPLCLGTTLDGWPRHPLYVAYATPAITFDKSKVKV